MLDRVVVGVDGRDGGRDALALARALGAGRLTLVAAHPVPRARGRVAAQRYADLLREEALRRLTEADGGAGAELVPCADPSPARAIQRLAAERGADLIVVGSAHHGPVARLVLGDVGGGVLRGAPCPVAVAPRGFRERAHEVRRVVVGYDGSPEAAAALELGARLARAGDGTLTACGAWDVNAMFYNAPGYAPDFDLLADAERGHAAEVLDAALASLPRAAPRLERGRAADVLEAASHDADLLVVGSRGWGPLRRIALGSTSDHLLRHAACPVVVVPRPAAAEGAGAAPQAVSPAAPGAR